MPCDCCGSSSSECKKNCSSSDSSEEESSSNLCYEKRRQLPTVWEPGVEGYFGEAENPGLIEACHKAGCKPIRKPYIKKNKHCYPRIKTGTIQSCEIDTCLVKSQCLKSRGAEIDELNIKGRLFLNGRDIDNREESVILSNYVGQVEVVPERPQDPLVLPRAIPIPRGVFAPILGLEMPYYVSLYHIVDRQGIRNLSELKELYSKIVLLNTVGEPRQVAFVLFIYSANGTPLIENEPRKSFVMHSLDVDIQTISGGGLRTFEVNWNSWRSSLNIIREAKEVAIFTALMPIDGPSDLAFLRTFKFGSESLSFRIFAIYNDYCVKEKCERECSSDED